MKNITVIALVLLVTTLFTGCSPLGIGVSTKTGGSENQGGQGGVYRSTDNGVTWNPMNYIRASEGQIQTIGYTNVRFLVRDPQDPRTVYAVPDDGSVWVSYALGDTWNKIFSAGTRIESLAVAPNDRKRLYIAGGRSILTSDDAGASWKRIYYGSQENVQVRSVAISYQDPKVVFAGTSDGTILKSRDAGETWFVPVRLSDFGGRGIVHRLLTVKDSPNLLYTAVVGNNLSGTVFVSRDGGTSWAKNEALTQVAGSAKYGDFERDDTTGNLYYASFYGMFISPDNGDSWKQIPLLSPPNTVMIYSLAVDPVDHNHIAYASSNGLYVSTNEGAEWKTIQLPNMGERVVRDLFIPQSAPTTLLLGAGPSY